MGTFDYEQEVHCEQCGKYLFTEEEKNGKWHFKKQPKVSYKYLPEEKIFLCAECINKHESFVYEI